MSDKYPGGFVTANAPAGFSVFFDGTGDGFSYTGTTFGSGAWTVELWFYFTGTSFTGPIGFFEGTTDSLVLAIMSSTTIRVDEVNVSNDLYTVPTMSANTWYHVAATKDASGNQTLFLNGVRSSTGVTTTSRNFSTATLRIGYSIIGATDFTGYISNLRFVTGTAVYNPLSTTINVPTQLFPISGTQLLICQSPTTIDNSSNAYTLTLNGTPTVSNFTPFAAYQGFNPALGAAAGGVWTLDEAAYYQNNRQWPIYDPYFNNTTLMLHGNSTGTVDSTGTPVYQNNTFLDSSNNNFVITRNGNTTQGSFSPFSQTGWSAYNSGSSSYCQLNNADYSLGTGDFTVEFWMLVVSDKSNTCFCSAPSNSNLTVSLTGGSAGARQPYLEYAGAGTAFTALSSYLNTWTHVAFVRSNGTCTVYQNGVALSSASKAGSVGSTANLYLLRNSGDASADFPGYVSNFRITKSAVYTSNFTPSTAPLTAVTSTVLLTFQDNRFVDDSALNATVTPTATTIQAFSPFVPAYITPTTYSNFFDGSTGYLSFPSSANFTFGTGDYTVEAWVNLNTSSTYQTMFGSSTTDALMFNIYSMNSVVIQTAGSNIFATFSGATFATNTWYHVAVSRSSGTVKAFVNGVQYGSTITSNTTNYALPTTNTIGSNAASQYFGGCLSSLRIVKGGALYTANFTPSTEPLTTTVSAGTVSLLTCQNSTFIDNSASANTLTATGSVKPVTSPTPFPAKVDTTTLNSAYSTSLIGGSAYFDGTTDNLSIANNANLSVGTGDFTWEAWVYPTTAAGSNNLIYFTGNGGFSPYRLTSGKFVVDIAGVSNLLTSTANVPVNAWTHYAFTRSGTTTRLFVNGALDVSGTSSANLTTAAANSIGDAWVGYLAGMRLIKGTALYTQSFATPIAPFTAITNTQLLCNFTNGAIFDNTAKNVLETVSGASLSTAQVKYGTTSMAFNGSSDYVVTPSSRLVSAWSGDCTIEGWYYTTSIANTPPLWMNSTSNSDGMSGGYVYSDGRVGMGKIGVSDLYSAVGLWSNNRWNHVAYVKAGATAYIFLNGTLVASGTATTYFETSTTKPMTLGRNYQSSPNYYTGYISDFRVTQGVARYTANFTPPTSQLQDQ